MSVLFDTYKGHCFFYGVCKHVEEALTPDDLHRAMEAHYADVHEAEIARIGKWTS